MPSIDYISKRIQASHTLIRHKEAAIKHEGTKIHKDHKGTHKASKMLKRHKELINFLRVL